MDIFVSVIETAFGTMWTSADSEQELIRAFHVVPGNPFQR